MPIGYGYPEFDEFLKPKYEGVALGIARPGYTPSWRPEFVGRFAPAESAVGAFRAEALRTPGALSPWGQFAAKSQALEAQKARERLMNQFLGAQAATGSTMAMRGGLTGGARERLAQETGRGFLGLSQDIGRQTRENLLRIGMEDEQARRQALSQLPQTEMMLPQYLTGMQMDELARQNAFKLQTYSEAMRAKSAENVAEKQRQAAEAQKGGILGDVGMGLWGTSRSRPGMFGGRGFLGLF